MKPATNKLIYLESLRGLASLLVVLVHIKMAFFPDFAFATNYLAAFAVRLFFLLSGFVLSVAYFRKRQDSVLISAALRRYPRLMIPVFASVMFAWLLLACHAYRNLDVAALAHQPAHSFLSESFRHESSVGQALFEGAIGTFFHFNPTTTLNPNLWTMPIELAGSFFVFALLATGKWIRLRVALYLVLGGILLFVLRRAESVFMFDFLVGVALCDFYVRWENTHEREEISPWLSVSLNIAGIIIGFESATWAASNLRLHTPGYSNLPTLASLLIVGGAAFSSHLQNALEHPVISFLGRLSFPLYLFHHAIICSAGCGFYLLLANSGLPVLTVALLASVFSLVIAVLFAWGAYYAVELTAIWTGRKVATLIMQPFGGATKR